MWLCRDNMAFLHCGSFSLKNKKQSALRSYPPRASVYLHSHRRVLNTACPGEPCFLLLLSKIQGKPLMRTSIPVSLFGESLFLFCILRLPRSAFVIKVVYCFRSSIVRVWDTRIAGSNFHGPKNLSDLTATLAPC